MAVSPSTQWEDRTTGNSANNGSGFDAIYGGVDASQQDAPTHIYTDLVSGLMPAPAAPTVAALAGGGTIPANTYYVCISYFNADGNHDSALSAQTAVVVGANGRIQVDTPPSVGGCEHFRVWISTVSGSGYRLQTTPNNPSQSAQDLGTNSIFTAYNAGTATFPGGTLFNQLSSVARPFVANDKGNVLTTTSAGSGAFLFINRFQVQNVIGGVATMSSRIATASGATGGAARLGGGASGGAGSFNSGVRGSNTVWVKTGKTVTNGSTGWILAYTGQKGRHVRLFGYGAARGDNQVATLNGHVNNTTSCVSIGGTSIHVKNINFLGTGPTATGIAVDNTATGIIYENCIFQNKNNGVRIASGPVIFHKCMTKDTSAVGLTSTGSGGFFQPIYVNYCRFTAAGASGGTGYGVWDLDGGLSIRNCIIDNCKFGIRHETSRFYTQVQNCTIDNNSTAGIQIGNSVNGDGNNFDAYDTLFFRENVFSRNAIAIKNDTRFNYGATYQETHYSCNAFWNNTANYSNLTAAPDDVALTVDPYENLAGGNYALNNLSGGGLDVKAMLCPGTFADGVNVMNGFVGFGGVAAVVIESDADAPIQNFVEEQFPTDISRGAKGGPAFKTTVTMTGGQSEQRIAHWSDPIRSWDVSMGARSAAQAKVLVSFFLAVMGKATGFRFKDWQDYEIETASNATLLTATTFQIVKRYTFGAVTKTRSIKKPVTGTVRVWNGGVEVLAGWTVDTTTGIITFAVAPGYTPSVTCEFDVPVRFDTDEMELVQEDIDIRNWEGIRVVELRY
jgi:uncharacterized protein (TIGR02217 family)